MCLTGLRMKGSSKAKKGFGLCIDLFATPSLLFFESMDYGLSTELNFA